MGTTGTSPQRTQRNNGICKNSRPSVVKFSLKGFPLRKGIEGIRSCSWFILDEENG
jgi:hypothetical protein